MMEESRSGAASPIGAVQAHLQVLTVCVLSCEFLCWSIVRCWLPLGFSRCLFRSAVGFPLNAALLFACS